MPYIKGILYYLKSRQGVIIMKTKRQLFYGQSSLKFYNREDIINGRVIKINPAIITILDKLDKSLDIDLIQEKVLTEVEILLKKGNIYTIHVDINFKDYNNFGNNGPAVKLGGEFLVCGTEIFNNKFGYSSIEVIENMLEQAAKALFN